MSLNKHCHLIAVAGGKGGVGKSVFAANLSFALQMELRAPTLLIDLDQKTCGDQNIITGLKPLKTVSDVSNHKGSINAQVLKNMFSTHSCGVSYLAAISHPQQTLNVDKKTFCRQLSTISQHYKYIVVDVGNELSDLQMAMIELCSAVLVITNPEILVINQTKRFINDLKTATVPMDLIQVIVNQNSNTGLNLASLQKMVGKKILGTIPFDSNTSQGALQRSTPFVVSAPQTALAKSYHDVVRSLTGGLLQKLKNLSRPSIVEISSTKRGESATATVNPHDSNKQKDGIHLRVSIHAELIKEMEKRKELNQTNGDPEKERLLRETTTRVISELVDQMAQGLKRDDRSQLIKEILDEALGLGPLEDLLQDPRVSEIMVNGADQIFVEKDGKLQLSPVNFSSNLQLKNVIERIVAPLGRSINEKTPYQDARLADGSRVNAVIEPLAIDGPSLTIRKFPTETITIKDYYEKFGSMTKEMALFLKVCVEQGLNVIVSGGTGSGKTTLLNCLSSFIPMNERIVTIEDAAELQLKQEHVVRLETRPPNIEGEGEVSIRDLVRNSLRMRPDRIVVGECRDGAALDMLAAMNTGHDGSMTTVHANNPREAVARLETLCLMAGMDLPSKSIKDQIAGAVHLFVQIGRLSDGSRKIKSITEVVGMQGETITLQEIFKYKENGFDKNRKIIGQFQATGMIPTFIEQFEKKGIVIPRNLFSNQQTSPPNQEKRISPLKRPTHLQRKAGSHSSTHKKLPKTGT